MYSESIRHAALFILHPLGTTKILVTNFDEGVIPSSCSWAPYNSTQFWCHLHADGVGIGGLSPPKLPHPYQFWSRLSAELYNGGPHDLLPGFNQCVKAAPRNTGLLDYRFIIKSVVFIQEQRGGRDACMGWGTGRGTDLPGFSEHTIAKSPCLRLGSSLGF